MNVKFKARGREVADALNSAALAAGAGRVGINSDAHEPEIFVAWADFPKAKAAKEFASKAMKKFKKAGILLMESA